MSHRRLLLLSNSSNYGEEYLRYSLTAIKNFLGREVKRVLFVPYAGITISSEEYAAKARAPFEEIGYRLDSLHDASDPVRAVEEAEALAVGGGNTFQLLKRLYETELLDAIRARVHARMPFVGWSAGANVACPTIRTTNDMPVVEPPSFEALNLVPFQLNPHYTDEQLPNHRGETRLERLLEFVEANPGVYVIGLREGSMLRIEDSEIALLGNKTARVLFKGSAPRDYGPHDSLRFLLTS